MHDYNPEWDYALLAPSPGDQDCIDVAIAEARLKLLPALQMTSFSIFCAEQGEFGEGNVGTFVNGTGSAPVIGLDLAQLKVASASYGLAWTDQLRATIAHELAHAYEETTGRQLGNEEAAENFARTFVMDGVVDVELLDHELSKATRHRRRSQ